MGEPNTPNFPKLEFALAEFRTAKAKRHAAEMTYLQTLGDLKRELRDAGLGTEILGDE